MKKKLIIIISVIVIGIAIAMLYQTFAVSSLISGNTDNTYDITLGGNTTVTVPAKSSKTVYYQVCNTNKGTVQYGVGYTSDNVVAKVYWNTTDPVQGTIEYGENKFVKLKLINDSTADDTIDIVTVLGYEFGKDLIPSSGVSLITQKIYESNVLMVLDSSTTETSYFLRQDENENGLLRNQISSITFMNDNIVPDGMIGIDVSANEDGTVMMWYGTTNSDGLYDVYIGSENGKVSISDASHLFSNMKKLKNIDFSTNIDTSNMTSLYRTFMYTSSLDIVDFSEFNTSKVTDMQTAFAVTGVSNLDLSSFDTSNVINMKTMFANCTNLTNLNIENFDTSQVTDMSGMFQGCTNLVELDVSNFDTSQVTTMSTIFSNCFKLKTIDVSNWDTSSVTNMYCMFYKCYVLEILDVSNFNTSKVTDMGGMFGFGYKLKFLDLSSFDTSEVTSMFNIFAECDTLTELDLSSFNTSKVTNMQQMFIDSDNLKTIYVSDNWKTSAVTNSTNMFNGCTALSGGSGTKYNASYIDATYARVDDVTNGNPGYFTYKAASA